MNQQIPERESLYERIHPNLFLNWRSSGMIYGPVYGQINGPNYVERNYVDAERRGKIPTTSSCPVEIWVLLNLKSGIIIHRWQNKNPTAKRRNNPKISNTKTTPRRSKRISFLNGNIASGTLQWYKMSRKS